ELDKGLPKKQSVEIKRWQSENGWKDGFNFTEPKERQKVLTALVKIWQKLL
ncbi:5565_t:CDS:1, partial [Diversispora eburnea]